MKNYRVWEINDGAGDVVYRVMPWSDKVMTENVKPVKNLESTDYAKARKEAKALGYRLSY